MEDMWRRKLEDDIPNKDRQKDKAHTIGFRDKQPLYATFTAEHPIVLRKNTPHLRGSRFNRGSDGCQVGSLASP